jgi:hypothetical protein
MNLIRNTNTMMPRPISPIPIRIVIILGMLTMIMKPPYTQAMINPIDNKKRRMYTMKKKMIDPNVPVTSFLNAGLVSVIRDGTLPGVAG